MTYSTSKKSTKYHLRPSKKSIKRRKSKFDSSLKDKVLISDASIQTNNYFICHEEVNENLGKHTLMVGRFDETHYQEKEVEVTFYLDVITKVKVDEWWKESKYRFVKKMKM